MIRLICFGKIKESYLTNLINDYKNRIGKYHSLEILELKDDVDIEKETKSLLNLMTKNEYYVLLDINGKQLNSEEFAQYIDDLFLKSGKINFIIGSSNGVSKIIKERCNDLISFSRMTMPHGLFRGVFLEQIYRAFKINNNERYHK